MDEAPGNRLHAEQTDAVEQIAALIATSYSQLLGLIRAAEDSGVWRVDGSASLDEWVSWRLRCSRAEARNLVEVAHALAELPEISARFDEGALSLEQVLVLVDFVEPESDAEWAERARGMHLEQLRAWRRAARRVTRAEAERDDERRSLKWWWDQDERFLHLKGKLPADQGAKVDKALSRLVEGMPKLTDGTYERLHVRGADALVELASSHIATDADPDRATIVVHVEAAALLGEEGAAALENGCELAPETVRRLACEASLQTVVNHNGRSIGVGRKTRTPPPWLRRLVLKRDGCCRFPGCTRKRHLQTHHVRHWTREGPTDLDNLGMLCPVHHKLVHEGGWDIRGKPDGELVFVRPDGRDYVPERPRLRDDIRERILGPGRRSTSGVPSAMDLCLDAVRQAETEDERARERAGVS